MDGAPTPPWYTATEYNAIITELDKRGFQTTSHSLSPAGTTMALDGYQAALAANGPRDRRQRIEHGSMIAPADMARFPQLQVIVSTQPAFCCIKGRPSNPWQTLWKSGTVIDFSSDWPCSWAPSPIEGIEQAAMRYYRMPTVGPMRGEGVTDDQLEERLTPEQALIAYTRNGAYANFWEDKRGTLEPGKLADLVVIDRNLLEGPLQTIGDAHVLATIVGGRIVYGKL
jgi:predicted amidohydrolase YtcJ